MFAVISVLRVRLVTRDPVMTLLCRSIDPSVAIFYYVALSGVIDSVTISICTVCNTHCL